MEEGRSGRSDNSWAKAGAKEKRYVKIDCICLYLIVSQICFENYNRDPPDFTLILLCSASVPRVCGMIV